MSKDRIAYLVDQLREIADSDENLQRMAYWETAAHGLSEDHWRGVPRRNDGHHIPFIIEPDNPMWFEILDVDPVQFYTDPLTYLETQLRMRIYTFQHFRDCTVVSRTVGIWLGVPFESSLFGVAPQYDNKIGVWVGRTPVLQQEADLERLPPLDFFTSGLGKTAHTFYEQIGEMLAPFPDFKVTFPEWGKGPFCVAAELRGLEALLCDLTDRPAFVHRLMRFVTDSRKRWYHAYAEYFHRPVIGQANIYNDEVGVPTLSPGAYEEFVLPYELDLCGFHGGIAYWHSCNNTTALMPMIRRIRPLGMLHVGPWSSLETAVSTFGHDTALEISLDPNTDILMATEEQMRARLHRIKELGTGAAITVRADTLETLRDLREDLERARVWNRVAQEVLAG